MLRSRVVSRRIVTLALLLVGVAACAGVLRTAADEPTGEPPPRTPRRSPPAVTPPPEAPEPGPADALAERCGQTCRHILSVTAGEVGTEAAALGDEPWLETCVEQCARHASLGQVECYERVTRPEELEACTVR